MVPGSNYITLSTFNLDIFEGPPHLLENYFKSHVVLSQNYSYRIGCLEFFPVSDWEQTSEAFQRAASPGDCCGLQVGNMASKQGNLLGLVPKVS